jgi:phospholipid transport system transporter-binding protein
VSGAELVEMGEGRFGVRGVLDFTTVGALLSKGVAAFGGRREVVLDLQGVTRSNSAGLALLLEWLDHGRVQGIALRFVNLPDSLVAIARMSNVDALLSLRQDGS